MIIKGIKCRKSRTLGYRISIPGDLDLSGNQVNEHHLSFVKIKDCTYTKNDKQYYNPNDPKAKSIRINHGGTWYGYGKDNIIDKTLTHSIIQTRFYAVNSGSVYTGIITKTVSKKTLIKKERINKLNNILK